MGECFLSSRGGSGSANLRAINVSVEDLLPERAPEGTIGFISLLKAQKIWVQNTEPEDFRVGDLWVMVTDSSNAPIQKKNVTIYPSCIRQCKSVTTTSSDEGTVEEVANWEVVTSFIWYKGQWEPLELWLFKTGEPYSTVTGGWAYDSGSAINFSPLDNISLDYAETEKYQLTSTVKTLAKVGAGKYKYLHIKSNWSGDCPTFTAGFYEEWKNITEGDKLLGQYDIYTTLRNPSSSGVTTLDLSILKPEYEGYLFIALRSSYPSDDGWAKIYEVWLSNEKLSTE